MLKKKVIYLSTFKKKKNSGIFYTQYIQKIDFIKIKHVHINVKIINPLHLLRTFKKLKKIIQKNDIIHSQYGSGCGLIGSFFKNKKIITLRGSDIENYGFLNDLYRFLVNKLTLFYIDKYDAIIVVSKRIKAKLIENKKKKFLFILPDPVNHKKFFRINRTKAKKILNLELSKRYIFFPVVDHNSKNKNFKFILKLKEKLQKINIHLLTANNKYDHKKMCLLFNACECTILASYTEGWPNVIKESIFCDTPVVSTDVSDLKILALKSKYIQISQLDVEEFYKRILFVLKLRRPRNLKKIISFCDLNYYLNSLKSLYQNI
jgi:hypothetical protein